MTSTPFGMCPPSRSVALRVLEEVDHLAQIVLGSVDHGRVRDGEAGVGLDVGLGPALADLHQAAADPPWATRRRARTAHSPTKSRYPG